MSQPVRSFSFTATTQSGRMMSFELPLHAQTASSENVARLLEGLLDALSDLIERSQGVSDGDVLQGLSLAMAVRLGVGGVMPQTAERLLEELSALAVQGAGSVSAVTERGRRH